MENARAGLRSFERICREHEVQEVKMAEELPSLAFLGGTGPEGRGLALRYAALGYTCLVGSRSAERGEGVARELREILPDGKILGMSNAEAAAKADIVIVTIPFEGHRPTLEALRDVIGSKLVVDTVNPLRFEKGRIDVLHVPAGSAAEEAQEVLPEAKVVGAFHNVSSRRLLELSEPVDTDILVCSDHKEAKRQVIDLASKIPGARGVDAGPLRNSRWIEALTAVILTVNKIYKTEAGIRVTGV